MKLLIIKKIAETVDALKGRDLTDEYVAGVLRKFCSNSY